MVNKCTKAQEYIIMCQFAFRWFETSKQVKKNSKQAPVLDLLFEHKNRFPLAKFKGKS